tara:strand:+ start:369 stop:578 length:210 start_codon:yes stop_codon:yes gene_type:complete
MKQQYAKSVTHASSKEPEKHNMFAIAAKDIIDDVDDIREILASQTGMSVSKANVVRACIKAWYELNNNG